MAVPIVDSETMVISPEEEMKVPLTVKMLGSYLSFVDSIIYRKDGTVNRRLQHYFTPRVRASSNPVNGVTTEDVVIDAANNVWLRVYTPTQEKETGKELPEEDVSGNNSEKKQSVILFYHGGGFVGLCADLVPYDKLCRKVAKSCNAVLVSVNYRVAPEFPYPAAYDDCYKVFDWLRSPESRSHLPATADISQCFLLGDSAGGNIVHFMGCRAAENDISPITLRGMVELQPFFGGEEPTPSEKNMKPPVLSLNTCNWAWRAFLPGENRDHFACNVLGPNSPHISGLSLPPILVVTGSPDILKDRQVGYVKRLKEMGKDVTMLNYAGGFHAFYVFEIGDVADKAMADVYDFIRSRTV